MIQEAYVSFEVAKLLKEKGFDIPTTSFYNSKKQYFLKIDSCLIDRNADFSLFSAPTHQMAMRWLREEKYILIFILPGKDDNGNLTYCADVWAWNEDEGRYEPTWATDNYIYEEAVESAIKHALKNLI